MPADLVLGLAYALLGRHRYRHDGNNHPWFGSCLGRAFCRLALPRKGQRFGQQVSGLCIRRRANCKAFLAVPAFVFCDFRNELDLAHRAVVEEADRILFLHLVAVAHAQSAQHAERCFLLETVAVGTVFIGLILYLPGCPFQTACCRLRTMKA